MGKTAKKRGINKMSNEMIKCLILSASIILFYRLINMKMNNKIVKLNVKSINKEDGLETNTSVNVIEFIRIVMNSKFKNLTFNFRKKDKND